MLRDAQSASGSKIDERAEETGDTHAQETVPMGYNPAMYTER